MRLSHRIVPHVFIHDRLSKLPLHLPTIAKGPAIAFFGVACYSCWDHVTTFPIHSKRAKGCIGVVHIANGPPQPICRDSWRSGRMPSKLLNEARNKGSSLIVAIVCRVE